MVEIKTAGEIQAMRAAGQVVARILAAVQDQAKAGMPASAEGARRDRPGRPGQRGPPRRSSTTTPGSPRCRSRRSSAPRSTTPPCTASPANRLAGRRPAQRRLSGPLSRLDRRLRSLLHGSGRRQADPADRRPRGRARGRPSRRPTPAAASAISPPPSPPSPRRGLQHLHRLRRPRRRPDHAWDPHVPNNGPPGRGYPLRPGLVLAIQPWFLAGGRDEIYIDRDADPPQRRRQPRRPRGAHRGDHRGRPPGPDHPVIPASAAGRGAGRAARRRGCAPEASWAAPPSRCQRRRPHLFD